MSSRAGSPDPRPATAEAPATTAPACADDLRKVYVEPTNACNLSCTTCVRHAWDESEGFMEWATFEAVVDGLADEGGAAAGLHAAGTIAFMGLGEPLLHPRFLDMVRLARARGLRTEVTTNALLLDDEMAGGLLAAGLDQLVVSIDGASAEAFGRVRSGASLERVVENVGRLHDRRGPNYGPGTRIGIEFVAMRSNVGELPGLNRLAAQLGATFIIVSNVLAYTPDLRNETLYDHRVTASEGAETAAAPRWQLPTFDWDEDLGAALGQALAHSGPVDFTAGDVSGVASRCPFVEADACAVAWHGGVSPCPPLLHTYACFVRGREKQMVRWEVGRLPDEPLAGIWAKPAYAAFRERVRRFDFPPCTDCGCDLAEGNEEDCFGNPHPVCGDCLWARGIVRCA
ncbi:MAG TPA: radical SAM protein [Thermoleophilia bacterium]